MHGKPTLVFRPLRSPCRLLRLLRTVEGGLEELTIDELAQRAGMTVRNVRAHQSRGLLPPPEVRARTGYYGPEHVKRLDLIREMQGDGFNLEAIRRLIGRADGAIGDVLDFKRAVTEPFETESPEILSTSELSERLGAELEDKQRTRAEKLGLLVRLSDERYEVPSPLLLEGMAELLGRGVSVEAALGVLDQMRRHSEAVARAFVKLFLEEVWKPFEQSGNAAQWPDVREAIERLRPMASQAFVSVFQQTMTAEVEVAFGRELEGGRRRSR